MDSYNYCTFLEFTQYSTSVNLSDYSVRDFVSYLRSAFLGIYEIKVIVTSKELCLMFFSDDNLSSVRTYNINDFKK